MKLFTKSGPRNALVHTSVPKHRRAGLVIADHRDSLVSDDDHNSQTISSCDMATSVWPHAAEVDANEAASRHAIPSRSRARGRLAVFAAFSCVDRRCACGSARMRSLHRGHRSRRRDRRFKSLGGSPIDRQIERLIDAGAARVVLGGLEPSMSPTGSPRCGAVSRAGCRRRPTFVNDAS